MHLVVCKKWIRHQKSHPSLSAHVERLTHASGNRRNFSFYLNLINMNLSHLCFCLSFSTKDQIVMVNGVSMENVHSNYTIQILKTCGKTANVVRREEPPGLIRVPLLLSERCVLHSSDCETPSQDPDPSDHQADSSRLPFQPAGPGPAQTNAALL